MTPQRAQALEAELRRLAAEHAGYARSEPDFASRCALQAERDSYTHAADLVRDAAKEGR